MPLAALFGSRAMVGVGPPLKARGPSIGSPPMTAVPESPVPSVGLLVTRSYWLPVRSDAL